MRTVAGVNGHRFNAPARLAVSGWSYGGYMTTWLLGNYPDRWRAGVAGASVTDHIDQYAFSDIHAAVATYCGGSPFTDPRRLQAYRDQAPITYATKKLMAAPSPVAPTAAGSFAHQNAGHREERTRRDCARAV